MSISVCMIVKNESECLPRCLDAAAGLYDELIIVDTGSTDDTVAIAERHGARVLHYDWQYPGNKGAARNVGLDAAVGDWIVVLDADEVLGDARGLRQALLDAPAHVFAFNVHFRNISENGAVELEWYQMRAFRRGRYRYIHREHEIPVACDGAGEVWMVDSIFDHRPPPARGPGKMQPMLDRLRLDVEEHPDDPHSLYMLARQYGLARRYAEAIPLAERYLTLPGSHMRSDVCRLAAICCMEQGDRRGGYEWMHRGTAYEPQRRLLWIELAHMYAADGHLDLALVLARMAADLPLPHNQRETQPVEHLAHICSFIEELQRALYHQRAARNR